MDRATQGFTIIEVLVATALFAIVVLVVLVPITGLFGLTKKSTTQVSATNLAQKWLEEVKGQWQNPSSYNAACIAVAPPAEVTIQVQNKDVQGNNTGAAYPVLVCGSGTATVAPLRLVTVGATVTTGSTTTKSDLSVEVAQ